MAHDLTEVAVNGAAALPVSTRHLERYTPDHYATNGTGTAPVYLLAPLTIAERRIVTRAVMRATGAFVTRDELREALITGAKKLLEPDESTRIEASLQRLIALEGVPADQQIDETRTELEALQAELVGAQNRLSRIDAPLRELITTQLEQLDTLTYFTVKACVRGWEHLAMPYQRRGDFVTEDAMAGIPDADLEELGTKCFTLREVTQDQESVSASL